MNKIIRRLAIVAVAAVLWTGPGLAQGALQSWDGSGFDHTTPLLGDESGDPIVRANLDAVPNPDGSTSFSNPLVAISGGKLTTDGLNPLSVTISSGPAPIVAWGATFDTFSGFNRFTFDVTGLGPIDVDVASGGNPLFIGIQETVSTFTSFSVMQTIGVPGFFTQVAPSLTNLVFQVERDQPPPPSVPEPTTLAIWSLLGLIGLTVVRRRRRV